MAKDKKYVFTNKQEFDEYNTKLLTGFLQYLDIRQKKMRDVADTNVRIIINQDEKIIEDFLKIINFH